MLISWIVKVSGSFLEILGDSINDNGLFEIYFSKIKYSKKLLKPDIILDWEEGLMDLDIEYINSLIMSGETFKGLTDLFLLNKVR